MNAMAIWMGNWRGDMNLVVVDTFLPLESFCGRFTLLLHNIKDLVLTIDVTRFFPITGSLFHRPTAAASEGKESDSARSPPYTLVPNLHYLGRAGIFPLRVPLGKVMQSENESEIHDHRIINIAYISGIFREEDFYTKRPPISEFGKVSNKKWIGFNCYDIETVLSDRNVVGISSDESNFFSEEDAVDRKSVLPRSLTQEAKTTEKAIPNRVFLEFDPQSVLEFLYVNGSGNLYFMGSLLFVFSRALERRFFALIGLNSPSESGATVSDDVQKFASMKAKKPSPFEPDDVFMNSKSLTKDGAGTASLLEKQLAIFEEYNSDTDLRTSEGDLSRSTSSTSRSSYLLSKGELSAILRCLMRSTKYSERDISTTKLVSKLLNQGSEDVESSLNHGAPMRSLVRFFAIKVFTLLVEVASGKNANNRQAALVTDSMKGKMVSHCSKFLDQTFSRKAVPATPTELGTEEAILPPGKNKNSSRTGQDFPESHIDILMTHDWPSQMIQDPNFKCRGSRPMGNDYCKQLRDELRPQLHVCGHMHRPFRYPAPSSTGNESSSEESGGGEDIKTKSTSQTRVCCLSKVSFPHSFAVFSLDLQTGRIREISELPSPAEMVGGGPDSDSSDSEDYDEG